MASRYFGRGSMAESDTLKPAKSTLLCANWNLSGFNTISADLTNTNKQVNCPPPILFKVRVVIYGVVNTTFLALKCREDCVKATIVAVP